MILSSCTQQSNPVVPSKGFQDGNIPETSLGAMSAKRGLKVLDGVEDGLLIQLTFIVLAWVGKKMCNMSPKAPMNSLDLGTCSIDLQGLQLQASSHPHSVGSAQGAAPFVRRPCAAPSTASAGSASRVRKRLSSGASKEGFSHVRNTSMI